MGRSAGSEDAGASAAYNLGMAAAAAGASSDEVQSWLETVELPEVVESDGTAAGYMRESAARQFETGFAAETANLTAGLAEIEAADEAAAETEAEA